MTITRVIRMAEKLEDEARFDLTQVTQAEKLFLWRHRQRPARGNPQRGRSASMTQEEAALELGIPKYCYARLEIGGHTALNVETASRVALRVSGIEPTIGELCFMARRRSGVQLEELEAVLGIGRPTFYVLEQSGNQRLIQHWQTSGYIFPTACN